MPTRFLGFGADGKHRWVRLPYVAAQYSVPPGTIEALRRNNEEYGSRQLLDEYGGPFAALSKVREIERDGRPFAVLFHVGSLEWALEVELTDGGLGEIRALPPEEAWAIARELDARVTPPVEVEGGDGGP